jgi:CheY-like chemotaxis protein
VEFPFHFFNARKDEARLCALHIDDSRWVRIPVSVVLRRQFGLRVLEANSGPEGIQIALRELPDLIILDIMMPQVDGFDTLAQLKADHKTKDIPVIMCTARSQTRDVNLAIKLGALGFLTKPIEESMLIQTVQNLLVSMGKWNEISVADRALLKNPPSIEKVLEAGAEPDPELEPKQRPRKLAQDSSKPGRPCPACRNPLTLIPQYDAWYCYPCRKYPDFELA